MKAGYLYENEGQRAETSEKGTFLRLDLPLVNRQDRKSTLASTLTDIYFHELDKFMKKLLKEMGQQPR